MEARSADRKRCTAVGPENRRLQRASKKVLDKGGIECPQDSKLTMATIPNILKIRVLFSLTLMKVFQKVVDVISLYREIWSPL